MADGVDVLREFLVSVGFKVDGAQNRQFLDAIAAATLKVVGLGTAIEAAAATTVAGVAKMASSFEGLYYASQRIGASVAQIQSLAFAGSQMGVGGDAMRRSLENLASFLRSNPGASGFLMSLGVQMVDPITGRPKSTATIFEDLGNRLRSMPYYLAQQYGQKVGIDQNVMFQIYMQPGALEALTRSYQRLTTALQFGDTEQQKAAENARLFMIALRNLGTVFDLIAEKAGSKLFSGLRADIQQFTDLIIKHAPDIVAAITSIARWLIEVGKEVTQLVIDGFQLVDWFDQMSAGTRRLIEGFTLLLVAWRSLSVGFLATPLGAFIASLGLILLLLDDYEGYTKGKRSEFDWSWVKQAQPQFKALSDTFGELIKTLSQIFHDVGGLNGLFGGAAGSIDKTKSSTSALNAVLIDTDTILKSIVGGLKWLDGFLKANPWLYRSFNLKIGLGGISMQYGGGQSQTLLGFGSGGSPPPGAPAHPLSNQQLGIGAGQSALTPGPFNLAGQAMRALRMRNLNGRDSLAVQFFMSMGWSRDDALGIVANLNAESGMNPNATGDGGHAYGIAQWHDDRQAMFKAVIGRDIHGSSFAQQLAFVNWELHHSEAAAGRALLGAANAFQAGAITSLAYERPAGGDTEAASRGASASVLGSQLSDSRIFSSPPTIGNVPTITVTAPRDGKSMVVNQRVDVKVSTKDNPQSVAQATKRAIVNSTGLMLRNLPGSTQ